MRLKVIGSGSAGNCYIVYNNTEALIIEAGLRFETIKKALDFDLSKVVGCVISHAHGDHCKGVQGVTSAGIDVFCQKATSDAFGYSSHRFNHIEPNKKFKVGNFSITGFELQHDVPCLGFYIQHEETGNFCFITDTYYCEYKLPALHNIIIEANYCSTILETRLQALSIHKAIHDRVVNSHMSLQTCKEFLQANDISKVNNIVLIHLSDGNSHAERFKREVKEQTVRTVNIAEAGLDIPFNKTPF